MYIIFLTSIVHSELNHIAQYIVHINFTIFTFLDLGEGTLYNILTSNKESLRMRFSSLKEANCAIPFQNVIRYACVEFSSVITWYRIFLHASSWYMIHFKIRSLVLVSPYIICIYLFLFFSYEHCLHKKNLHSKHLDKLCLKIRTLK